MRFDDTLVALLSALLTGTLFSSLVPATVGQAADGRRPSRLESTVDASITPGDDFFAYANGGWLKATALPAGNARWGARDELEELTRRRIAALLDAASAAPAGSVARKVADFHAAYLNEAAIEARGLASLKPLLDRVEKVCRQSGAHTPAGSRDARRRRPDGLRHLQVSQRAGAVRGAEHPRREDQHRVPRARRARACRTARTISAPSLGRKRFAHGIASTSARCSRSLASTVQANVRARC